MAYITEVRVIDGTGYDWSALFITDEYPSIDEVQRWTLPQFGQYENDTLLRRTNTGYTIWYEDINYAITAIITIEEFED